jgi:hypothetical protein
MSTVYHTLQRVDRVIKFELLIIVEEQRYHTGIRLGRGILK